jgi:hypothetical protein
MPVFGRFTSSPFGNFGVIRKLFIKQLSSLKVFTEIALCCVNRKTKTQLKVFAFRNQGRCAIGNDAPIISKNDFGEGNWDLKYKGKNLLCLE